MTSVQHRSEAVAPVEPSRNARRVRVGLIVADVHVGMALDAVAPVARQVQAVVDLANARLGELGRPRLEPTGGKGAGGKPVRGRWALCWVDGTPLRLNRSLTDQGVVEGTQLWLQFVDDTEARKPVIEHVTSAVPAELRKNWRDITPAFGARVGVAMVAAAVGVVLAVLVRWRYGHDGVLAGGVAAGVAVVLLVAASVIGVRSARHRRVAAQRQSPDRDQREDLDAELFLSDVLRLIGVAAAAVAAALAVPGPLGAPHAGMAAAVVLAARGADHPLHRAPCGAVHGGDGARGRRLVHWGGADAVGDLGGDAADDRAAGGGGGDQARAVDRPPGRQDPPAGVSLAQRAVDL